jgi:S1 RNA binding domain protein
MEEGPRIGDVVEVEVFKITNFGAFVKFARCKGLIHISQVSDNYVKNINQYLKVGDRVKARVIKVSPDGKIDLSLKQNDATVNINRTKEFKFSDFEQKLKDFLKKVRKSKLI